MPYVFFNILNEYFFKLQSQSGDPDEQNNDESGPAEGEHEIELGEVSMTPSKQECNLMLNNVNITSKLYIDKRLK